LWFAETITKPKKTSWGPSPASLPRERLGRLLPPNPSSPSPPLPPPRRRRSWPPAWPPGRQGWRRGGLSPLSRWRLRQQADGPSPRVSCVELSGEGRRGYGGAGWCPSWRRGRRRALLLLRAFPSSSLDGDGGDCWGRRSGPREVRSGAREAGSGLQVASSASGPAAGGAYGCGQDGGGGGGMGRRVQGLVSRSDGPRAGGGARDGGAHALLRLAARSAATSAGAWGDEDGQ